MRMCCMREGSAWKMPSVHKASFKHVLQRKESKEKKKEGGRKSDNFIIVSSKCLHVSLGQKIVSKRLKCTGEASIDIHACDFDT